MSSLCLFVRFTRECLLCTLGRRLGASVSLFGPLLGTLGDLLAASLGCDAAAFARWERSLASVVRLLSSPPSALLLCVLYKRPYLLTGEHFLIIVLIIIAVSMIDIIVMYVCMYVCVYVSMYVCMCVCMCVCMYVCMYVCVYEWRRAESLHRQGIFWPCRGSLGSNLPSLCIESALAHGGPDYALPVQ